MGLDTDIRDCLARAVTWRVSAHSGICLADLREIGASTEALVQSLPAEAAKRAQRLVDETRRREFAASRHLAQALISQYPPARVHSWSRSEGRLAFAYADAAAMGVDLECVRPLDFAAILGVICGDDERDELAAAGRLDEAERFFRIWTAKEAIMKAMGSGFQAGVRSVRLNAAALALDGNEQVTVQVTGRCFLLSTRRHGAARISFAAAD